MTTEERRGLWRSLGVLEDWLLGGVRRERAEPDFEGDSLVTLAAEIGACTRCRLAETRRKAVPGQGVESPLVMVIGEGPGAEEDERGLPFVGPAGRLLDKMLASVGLDRGRNCFISNLVKCRPPGNRDPEPDERAACAPYLRRQIALLRPRALLCLGRVAAQALLEESEGIGALRGRWMSFEGLPLLATYHPSALLRDEALKRPAWEDLKMLRDFLASPSGEGAAGAAATAGAMGAGGSLAGGAPAGATGAGGASAGGSLAGGAPAGATGASAGGSLAGGAPAGATGAGGAPESGAAGGDRPVDG